MLNSVNFANRSMACSRALQVNFKASPEKDIRSYTDNPSNNLLLEDAARTLNHMTPTQACRITTNIVKEDPETMALLMLKLADTADKLKKQYKDHFYKGR
ncbi:MAG: hypothetical protein A2Y25_08125 [Candidatus Melainabacteria bacterium GWF2_37_15]|nr:MAG: hypothetical protein A2Y25_08125 [Candidatus Melainabacteria bacterium GWF2_37_15]